MVLNVVGTFFTADSFYFALLAKDVFLFFNICLTGTSLLLQVTVVVNRDTAFNSFKGVLIEINTLTFIKFKFEKCSQKFTTAPQIFPFPLRWGAVHFWG